MRAERTATAADHHTALDRRAGPAATPRGLRSHWFSLEERIAPGELKPAASLAKPHPPARFAFATRLNAFTKPYVFPDGAALARSIHRRRDGQTIQVIGVDDLRAYPNTGLARVLPRDRACPGARVLLQHDGDAVATLGWVWADGANAARIRTLIGAHPIPLTPRQTAD